MTQPMPPPTRTAPRRTRAKKYPVIIVMPARQYQPLSIRITPDTDGICRWSCVCGTTGMVGAVTGTALPQAIAVARQHLTYHPTVPV